MISIFPWPTEAYTTFKGSTRSSDEWIEGNKDMWSQVLPKDEMQRLTEAPAGHAWVLLSDEVQKVVSSGALGRKLFGFALQKILCETVAVAITNECKAMLKQKVIDSSVFVQSIKQAKVAVAGITGSDTINDRRPIEIRYRGWPIVLKITCLAEEIHLRHAVALRGHAVETGDLIPLVCEEIRYIYIYTYIYIYIYIYNTVTVCMYVKLYVYMKCQYTY